MKCFAAVLGLLLPALAWAQPQIPFTGQLSENGVLVTGNRDIAVRIYGAQTGGAVLHLETFTNQTVTNGVFHVLLTPPLSLWTGADRWIGVTVGGGSELVPRTKIGFAPYAAMANMATFSIQSNQAQEALRLASIPAEPFAGSTIMSPEEQFQVNIWCGNVFRSWTLCYRRSAHGADAAEFHTRCDRRGPTLTIMRLGNSRVLGGYTGAPWWQGGYVLDPTAFLFSLTAGKTYGLGAARRQNAVYGDALNGPTFGGPEPHDVKVDGGMSYVECNLPYTYVCNGAEGLPSGDCQYELCGVFGPGSEIIEELEVWVAQ